MKSVWKLCIISLIRLVIIIIDLFNKSKIYTIINWLKKVIRERRQALEIESEETEQNNNVEAISEHETPSIYL